MDLQLKGKRALVTGSSDGIGEAIAIALAKEGVSVVVHGRNETKAQRVAKEIIEAGGRAVVVIGDLSRDDDANRVVKEALTAFDGIDILVNNVGAFPQKPWLETTATEWNDLYNQNVGSMVRMITGLVPAMKARGWGRVIQISSGAGIKPVADMANYATTKTANIMVSVSLAQELSGSGITVNTVSPGPILTTGMKEFANSLAAANNWGTDWDEIERRFAAQFATLTKKVGRPEDIANLVTFLSSPLAGNINASNLRSDGGFLATIN